MSDPILYDDFIARKSQLGTSDGFKSIWLPEYLKDFQAHCVDLALHHGRFALFEDCGLGKTPQEFVWCENVVRHTNGRVLLVTFHAVVAQMLREAEKFGVKITRSNDGVAHPGITVTNYEQLHKFNPADFVGMCCDESGIIKDSKSATRAIVISMMRKMRYRLCASATASPNDFTELGNHSEALGYLGHVDMLNRFFKNDLNNSAQGRMRGAVIKWRLKGHAELPFWRYICSWARCIRKPSDLGFDDTEYELPPLIQREHLVKANTLADGMLFELPAVGLREQREESRRTIEERCEKAAQLVIDRNDTSIIWCDLNPEGEYLEKIIPDCVQVSGKDSAAAQEEKLMAFVDGKVKRLVTKQKIGGWGMNYQHCNHEVGFPTNSYEGAYQRLRRIYRFGQKRTVYSDIVTTEGGQGVLANQQRKAAKADEMFNRMTEEMHNALGIVRVNEYTQPLELPSWI